MLARTALPFLILSLLSLSVACDGSMEVNANSPEQMEPDLVASADMMSSADQDRADLPGADQGQPQADMDDEVDMPAGDMGASDQGGTEDMAVEDMAPPGPPKSAGCMGGQGIAEGEHTFMLEGRQRKFVMRLPNNYDPQKPWPLVFALHGNGGNTGYWDGTGGDRNIRGVLQDKAVLIVAEAIEGNWRDYNDRPNWESRIESELLYFDELIERAKSDLCINTDAIFSMGFSGGGSYSGVLGCRRTDIRAIAVGGSVIYFDEDNCVGTPAAWITIGTEELTGGREAYRDWFRDLAGCTAETEATEPDPCIQYKGCGAETPVHYCQHPGGHQWPGFGVQATWDFFSQFVEGG